MRTNLPGSWRNSFYRLKQQVLLWSAYSDESVRERQQRLRGLKDSHQGERCFIMGNGPSLNKMNLNLLEKENVWGSNRCYLLFDRFHWRPKFYVAVDKRVVPDNQDHINDLPNQLPKTQFFYPVEFRVQNTLSSHKNVYWYDEEPLCVNMGNLPEGTFTTDASKRVYAVFTVTIAALQLASYLGFNPIYLIGCDTSYAKVPSIQQEGASLEELISTSDNDPNHFDSRYFGQGKKFHEPHVARMIFQYHEARLVCDSLGTKVYNATVGGSLEEFERVDFQELFYKGRG